MFETTEEFEDDEDAGSDPTIDGFSLKRRTIAPGHDRDEFPETLRKFIEETDPKH